MTEDIEKNIRFINDNDLSDDIYLWKYVDLHKFISLIISKSLHPTRLDKNGIVALDGLACAKWLVYESGLDLRNSEFKVHSANPVASEQIKGLLTNYIKHLNDTE